MALVFVVGLGAGTVSAALNVDALQHILDGYGVPSVAAARYVRVHGAYNLNIQPPLPGKQIEASGWLLEETLDDEGRPVSGKFLINGVEQITLRPWRLHPPWGSEIPDLEKEIQYATWTNAPLDRDLKRAHLALTAPTDDTSWPARLDDPATQGRALLFAAQLSQYGRAADASNRVAELARHIGPRQDGLTLAATCAADGQYQNFYRDFRATLDWSALLAGVDRLVTNAPAGWTAAPGMTILRDKLAERIAATNPLGGSFADRLATLPHIKVSASYVASPIAWLLPATWTASVDVAGNADLEIRARSMAAFPLLLAMAADKRLTPADSGELRNASPWNRPFPSSRDWDVFEGLERPAMLGEVAQRILWEIIPEAFRESSAPRCDVNDTSDIYEKFYEKHKDASDEQLAVLYLRDSYDDQRSPALAQLMSLARDQRLPAFEDFLLNGADDRAKHSWYSVYERIEQRAGFMAQYAHLRGPEVYGLVSQMVDRIDAMAPKVTKPKNYSFSDKDEERKYVEQQRAKLLKAGQNLRDLMNPVTPPPAAPGVCVLVTNLPTDMPLEIALTMQLQAAADAATTDERHEMFCQISQWLDEVWPQAKSNGPAAWPAPTTAAACWTNLIVDERRASADSPNTLGADFLCLNEALFGWVDAPPFRNDEICRQYGCYQSKEVTPAAAERRARLLLDEYGPPGADWLRRRVGERVRGTPNDKLPPFPEDYEPDAAALDAMRALITPATNREDAVRIMQGLNPLQRRALQAMATNDMVLGQRWLAMANTVTDLTITGDDAAAKVFESWRGQAITPELIAQMREYCTAQTMAGRAASCQLLRGRDLDGCVLTIANNPPGPAAASPENRKNQDVRGIVGYEGFIAGFGVYQAACQRTVSIPEGMYYWHVFHSSHPDYWRGMPQAAQEFCDNPAVITSPGIVRFNTVER